MGAGPIPIPMNLGEPQAGARAPHDAGWERLPHAALHPLCQTTGRIGSGLLTKVFPTSGCISWATSNSCIEYFFRLQQLKFIFFGTFRLKCDFGAAFQSPQAGTLRSLTPNPPNLHPGAGSRLSGRGAGQPGALLAMHGTCSLSGCTEQTFLAALRHVRGHISCFLPLD